MGLLSWLSSRRTAGKPGRHRLRSVPAAEEDPRIEQMKRDAAADVAAVEEDARYFRRADPEDDL